MMEGPLPFCSSGAQPGEEMRALLDAAVHAVVLIDHIGRIEAFNHAAERLFGYEAAEILGQNVSTLMAEPERSAHDGHLARYAHTRVSSIIGTAREVTARRKDGSVFPVLLSVGAVRGAEPPRFVGFMEDLTHKQEAAEQSRRLQERLMHVSRLATVGEMASGIAHEVNQPLAAVANYAQAGDRLLALPEPDLGEVRGALQQIAAQAIRAGDIIRRLLSLARSHPPMRVPTGVNTLLEEMTDLVQADARARGIDCRMQLGGDLPAVDVDRAQIQQVVMNLVHNAMDALVLAGTAVREITITTCVAPDGHVEICVGDSGPGVSDQVAARMFDPFYTTKETGTGLGLAISRTIVSAHRGTLVHRANVPAGACFIVRLPPATWSAPTAEGTTPQPV